MTTKPETKVPGYLSRYGTKCPLVVNAGRLSMLQVPNEYKRSPSAEFSGSSIQICSVDTLRDDNLDMRLNANTVSPLCFRLFSSGLAMAIISCYVCVGVCELVAS